MKSKDCRCTTSMCPDSCVPTSGKIHPDEIAGEWLSDIELAAGWSAISLLVNDTSCEGAYVSPGHTKGSHGLRCGGMKFMSVTGPKE